MKPAPRYRKLGYVELNVTDLARSRHFYEHLVGLEYVGEGLGGALRFRCGDDPHNVVLHKGAQAGHKRAGWMVEDEGQFEPLIESLRRRAVAYEELSPGECGERGFRRAVRIVEPVTRAVVEFYENAPPDAHYYFNATLAKIQRLGHVVYTSPRLEELVAFYGDVLNFAESDSIEGAFTFMRPWPNPYHHGLGLGRMDRALYHHTNFMTSEIDDIGKAIHRFNAAGVPIVHGPGRHPASGSLFLYFLDPDGLTCEYSFGMEQFPEAFPRPPRVMKARAESRDSWGAPTDPRMGAAGAIETYEIRSSRPAPTRPSAPSDKAQGVET